MKNELLFVFLQKKMLLKDLIVKYREASSMSQSMFVDELAFITSGSLAPSVGVLNGIEHGSGITDEHLFDYLSKRFLYLDVRKNKTIVDITYNIATYCSTNLIKLDIPHLLSSFTIYDVIDYLDHKIPNLCDIITEKEQSFMFFLSKNIDIGINPTHYEFLDMNDSGIFVYNLAFWYFLQSNNKDVQVTKDDYSDPNFVVIAELYGFNQFSKTSAKSKSKIARTIAKRYSLYKHFDNLLESSQYYVCFKEFIESGFIDSLKLDEDSEQISDFICPFSKETLNDVLSVAKELSSFDKVSKDIDPQLVKKIVKMTSSLHTSFLYLFAFLQGIAFPSKSYLKILVSRFNKKDDRLNSIIEKYVSEFNYIYDNKQFDKVDRLFFIQKGLFNLIKYSCIIDEEIEYSLEENI